MCFRNEIREQLSLLNKVREYMVRAKTLVSENDDDGI
jgi:hypothetical protein